MVTLFNVVSEDGFLAGPDGEEDFIPDTLWPKTLEVFSRYDTHVLGRKTYEVLQDYPPELLAPLEALPLKHIVVSADENFKPKEGYALARSLPEAFAGGGNILVVSGPGLNEGVLRAGLADRVLWQVVPVSIHEGIRPFDPAKFPSVHPERI